MMVGKMGIWSLFFWLLSSLVVVYGNDRTLRAKLLVDWIDCPSCRSHHHQHDSSSEKFQTLLVQMKTSLATTQLYQQLYSSLPTTNGADIVVINPATSTLYSYTTSSTSHSTLPSCQVDAEWNSMDLLSSSQTNLHPYSTNPLPDEASSDEDEVDWIVYGNMQQEKIISSWLIHCTATKNVVFRPILLPTADSKGPNTALNGYGVRLDLRNVEYQSHYVSSDTDTSTGSHEVVLPTEKKFLSYQLLQHLAGKESADVLKEYQEMVWNFPTYAHSLSQIEIEPPTFHPTPVISPGLYTFGNLLQPLTGNGDLNIFSLVQKLSTQSTYYQESFETLSSHISTTSTILPTILQSNTVSSSDQSTTNSYNQIRVDVGRGTRNVIWYVNNQESKNTPPIQISDQEWMWSLQMGAPLTIPKNLYTIVIVIDPLDSASKTFLSCLGKLQQLLSQQFSIRLGFIFHTNNSEKVEEVLISQWLTMRIADQYGYMAGISFLQFFVYKSSGDLSVREIVQLYLQFYSGNGIPSPSLEDVHSFLQKQESIHSQNKSRILHAKVQSFMEKKKLSSGMMFLNGIPIASTPTDIMATIQEETTYFYQQQELFFSSNKKTVYATLLSSPHFVISIYHPILQQQEQLLYKLSWSRHPFFHYNKLSSDDVDEKVPHYLVEGVVDLTTLEGFQLVHSMIQQCTSFEDIEFKLACRFVPSNQETVEHELAPVLFTSYLQHGGSFWKNHLQPILSFCIEQSTCLTLPTFQVSNEFNDIHKKEWAESIQPLVMSASTNYKKQPKHKDEPDTNNFLLLNGRIFEPLNGKLEKADLDILFLLEQDIAKNVWNHISYVDITTNVYDAIGRMTAFLSKEFHQTSNYNDDVVNLHQFLISYSTHYPERVYSYNKQEQTSMQMTAILDPLSEMSQRIISLLRYTCDELQLPLNVVFVPKIYENEEDTIIPLTSYYRFVLTEEEAFFNRLPTNHILTLKMDVPEQWDVQQIHSIQDTDNLDCNSHHCGDVPHDDENTNMYHTDVEYGLKSLLFFGQCYDVTAGTPPNGLPLTLTNAISSTATTSYQEIQADGSLSSTISVDGEHHHSDTVVMKTIGYWQLQANPGIWTLKIAPESRGAEIYNMVQGKVDDRTGKIELDESSSIQEQQTKTLIMKDFVDHGELLLVKRKPGFEGAELFRPQSQLQEQEEEDDDDIVHVFSLATGHLYERFLKIMMLSVTKRTSSRVKFWLFENYLSPSFKASAMDMAKQIGCQVSFVTYKWPNWLRGQSVKQRIIWGYKILFLDVLFPLNLKKIIYVDADQVVRGDLKELWDMDLKGAPYGYTPMCSSREETLGYQFWRTGFWKGHLRDKPYHISALYVVDLQRFRRDLVGDKLRQYYQQLSADPHSLSNLDQDLPNYAQFDVPIFSLPQEWLWCESWCSDETKSTAKTIDLCNNPEHKEPKVSMAKRIISGPLFQESWIELDAEVEKYERSYLNSIL